MLLVGIFAFLYISLYTNIVHDHLKLSKWLQEIQDETQVGAASWIYKLHTHKRLEHFYILIKLENPLS